MKCQCGTQLAQLISLFVSALGPVSFFTLLLMDCYACWCSSLVIADCFLRGAKVKLSLLYSLHWPQLQQDCADPCSWTICWPFIATTMLVSHARISRCFWKHNCLLLQLPLPLLASILPLWCSSQAHVRLSNSTSTATYGVHPRCIVSACVLR